MLNLEVKKICGEFTPRKRRGRYFGHIRVTTIRIFCAQKSPLYYGVPVEGPV